VHRHQSICNKNAMEWPKWTTILITLASVLVVAAVFQFRHQLHEGISAGLQKIREKYTHDEDAHIRVLTSALVKHEKEIQYLREVLATAKPTEIQPMRKRKKKRNISENPNFPGVIDEQAPTKLKPPDSEEDVKAPVRKKRVIVLNIKKPEPKPQDAAKELIAESKVEVNKVLRRSIEGTRENDNDYDY